jgi:hypothetical protein
MRRGGQGDIGVLRIDFPGYSGHGNLQGITWEEFFDKFDERNLALVYEEETPGGERSNFNKIVNAETAGETTTSRTAARSILVDEDDDFDYEDEHVEPSLSDSPSREVTRTRKSSSSGASSKAKSSRAQPLPEPASPRNLPTAVFISYRREDAMDIVGRLADRLGMRFGKKAIFRDVDSMPLGVDFRQHLQQVLSRCGVVVVVIGNKWSGPKAKSRETRLDDPNDHLRLEIETALKRDIPVIPVFVQGVGMPFGKDLPPSLRPLTFRNGIPLRPDPDFNRDVVRLIHGIEQHLNR